MNLNPFRKIKYLKDSGRPQTLVRTRTKLHKNFYDVDRKSEGELRKYWNLYHEETTFPTINSICYNTVMVGYRIESDNTEAKQFIQRLCNNINLDESLLEATQHVLIFGDAYLEKRRIGSGEVVKLHPVDPKTMTINYNEYGDIQSYQQEINGNKTGDPIKPEDIIHVRFIPIPGSPYGVSLIEINKDTIERKVRVDEAIFNAVIRHALRKWVATVGTEKDGQLPDDDVMDAITTKLEDIDEIKEIVVPWMIKLETIDEGNMEGLREYYDLFQAQLVSGIGGLEEAGGVTKGVTEACNDEVTEVLTIDGWKKYWELSNDSKIATYNPDTSKIEYHEPLDSVDKYVYNHDGPMIRFESENVDMMVTPNHRMYTNKNPRATKENWGIIEAKEMMKGNSQYEIKSAVIPQNKSCGELNDYEKKLISKSSIDTFMKFLGYFVSEGSINRDRPICRLSQKKPESSIRIQNMLKRFPINFNTQYTNGKGYEFAKYNRELWNYLKEYGKDCYNRRIPRRIILQNPHCLEVLLKAAVDGDGSITSKTRMEYCTTSEQLADDIQEIALRCGYRTLKSFDPDDREDRVGTWRVSIRDGQMDYAIIQSKKNAIEVDYKGKVYSLNVPNHIYITRRNGRISIQGNSSRIKAILFERKIKSFQYKWSTILKAELFDDALLRAGFREKDNSELPITVNLVFHSVTDEDEAMKAKWIGNLLRGFPKGRPLPYTVNEIRSWSNLGPIDGGDVMLGTIEPDEKKRDTNDENEEESEEEEYGYKDI